MPADSDAARMDLDADAWHQNQEGNYYIDCPECGSAASISNVVAHGRCDGYMDERESETELDESSMSCTAKLSFELVYTSDPSDSGADDAVGDDGDEGTQDDGNEGTQDDEEVEGEYEDSPAESN